MSAPDENPENEGESGNKHEDAETTLSSSVVILPPEAIREAAERGQPVRVSIQALYSGPLPPPIVLREYEQIVPGLPSVLIDEFRAETKHRRALQRVGQYGGLGVAIISIIAGGFFGWLAGDWRLTLAITVPVCGAVGIAQLVEFWLKLK